MLKRDDFGFPTFWPLQIAGWCCYYLSVFILLLPSLKQPGTLRGSGLWVAVMFAASCLMRPVCRFLMRRGLSWIALEMGAIVCCIPAGAIAGYVIEVVTSPNRPAHGPDWLARSAQATFLLFLWCNLYLICRAAPFVYLQPITSYPPKASLRLTKDIGAGSISSPPASANRATRSMNVHPIRGCVPFS